MKKNIQRYKEMYPTSDTGDRRKESLYMFPWSPLFPLALHCFGHCINERWDKSKSLNPVRLFFKAFYHIGRFLSVVMRKTEIVEEAQIAKNVFISPKGNIILGANSIGDGCTIHHNVTIGFGFGRGRKLQRPDIGRNVWIGPGSIIYGNINVGDGAVIGPDTVVNKTVPPRFVIYGNPARVVQKNYNNVKFHKTNSPHIFSDINTNL